MLIRQASRGDEDAIWEIIAPVIRAGETYAIDPDISREKALEYWLGSDRETFVAESEGALVEYLLHPCKPAWRWAARLQLRLHDGCLRDRTGRRPADACAFSYPRQGSGVPSHAVQFRHQQQRARFGCGSRSISRSWVGCRKRSSTPLSALSTPSSCTVHCSALWGCSRLQGPPGTKEHNLFRPFRYPGRYPGAKTVSGERERPGLSCCILGRRLERATRIRTRDPNLGKVMLYP